MATNEELPSHREEETSPSFFREHTKQSFLIRKASVELKITLDHRTASVEVANCSLASRPLAESVARMQQQLLGISLRYYTGENIYAYLLALYNDQGWSIREAEEAVFGGNETNTKTGEAKS